MDDPGFLARLEETFRQEALDHLAKLRQGLKGAPSASEALFREAHSLKGAARAVDRRDVEALAQELESSFGSLPNTAGTWSPDWLRQQNRVLDRIEDALGGARDEETVRVPVAQLELLLRQAEELVQGGDARARERLMERHLETVKELLVLPASLLTDGLGKMVRDLAADQGKEAVLSISGNELRVDKRLLEELKAPLIHLLRNGVDHGIEPPAVRVSRRKPPTGRLTLEFRRGEKGWHITVEDDGQGLDRERLVRRAIAGGMEAAAARALDAQEQADLVFRAGLSTRNEADEISGRGLGLAIVRETVERLGGAVTVESFPERGTVFSLEVPLSLSTMRAVAVLCGGQTFLVPSADIQSVRRERGTAASDGVRRVSLSRVLSLPGGPADYAVRLVGRPLAVLVDDVLVERWVLVKPLGPPLGRLRPFAGAVIDVGRVVPVLSVDDLEALARDEGITL